MSSGCGDVLSLADLQTAKKHQIFEAEVITGKSGGVVGGADIDYATNPVTGQAQKTLPAVLRDAGFSPVSWDFSTGGTLTATDRDKVVYDPVSLTWYSYAGALPVVVPAGFNPVGNADWKPVNDWDLRSELEAPGGAGFVGGLAKPVTWSGFAGGADPTGVVNSDGAFASAALFSGDVYVPTGTYLLNSIHKGNFIVDNEAKFIGSGCVMLKRRSVWAEPGAPVNPARYPRLFVGDTAYDYSGAKDAPSDQSSWLGRTDDTAPNGTPQPNLGWIEKNATFASYSSYGAIGIAGASHNKEMPTGGAAIGIVGAAVNDNESGVTNNVWALYLDAKRYPNAKGTTWCAEMAIVNHGTYVDMHSADNRGKTTGISLVAGADPTINGTTEDCTQALAISSNGSKWGAGIAYPIGSLRTFTESGLTDVYQKAIVMRNTHRIGWEDGAGNSLSYLQSRVSTNAVRMGAVFRDRSFDLEGNGLRAFRLSYADGDTGAVRLRTASITDPRIRISAEGISNCSIALEALGTGTVTVNKPLTPTSANTISCGTSALPWSGGFTQTAFQITSDRSAKMEEGSIPDAVLDAWGDVQYVSYKLKASVAEKGSKARKHIGVIAQDIKEAFEAHGVDPFEYGILCYDNIPATEAVYDTLDDGTKVLLQEAEEAYSRYTVRYEEMLCLEAAYMRRELLKLKSN